MQTAPGANEGWREARWAVAGGGIARRWRVTRWRGTTRRGPGGCAGREPVEQSSYPPRAAHAEVTHDAGRRRRTCQPPVTNEKRAEGKSLALGQMNEAGSRGAARIAPPGGPGPEPAARCAARLAARSCNDLHRAALRESMDSRSPHQVRWWKQVAGQSRRVGAGLVERRAGHAPWRSGSMTVDLRQPAAHANGGGRRGAGAREPSCRWRRTPLHR